MRTGPEPAKLESVHSIIPVLSRLASGGHFLFSHLAERYGSVARRRERPPSGESGAGSRQRAWNLGITGSSERCTRSPHTQICSLQASRGSRDHARPPSISEARFTPTLEMASTAQTIVEHPISKPLTVLPRGSSTGHTSPCFLLPTAQMEAAPTDGRTVGARHWCSPGTRPCRWRIDASFHHPLPPEQRIAVRTAAHSTSSAR